MKNIIIIILVSLLEIVSWILFSLSDLVIENCKGSYTEFISYLAFVIPILIPIIYFIFENKVCKKFNITKIKLYLISLITWLLESTIFGIIICNLVNNKVWIIEQRYTYLSLNGIEYYLFSILLGILPIILLFIFNIIKYIKDMLSKK